MLRVGEKIRTKSGVQDEKIPPRSHAGDLCRSGCDDRCEGNPGIDWQPVSYSTVRISTSADTFETNGEGDFIRGQNYSVRWNHDWLERVSTSFSVTQQNDEYVFNELDIVNRDDELMNYSAALNYRARRWLKFSTFYQYTDRDSNRDTIGYDRSEVGVTVEVTL